MIKKYKKLFLILFLSLILFFIFSPINPYVFADKCNEESGEVCLNNPLGSDTTPQGLIGRVIIAVLGIVGSLALAMFIYGGLTWMTAAGNNEKVQKGRDILIWATIGLIIIFASYALVRFVIFDMIGAPRG